MEGINNWQQWMIGKGLDRYIYIVVGGGLLLVLLLIVFVILNETLLQAEETAFPTFHSLVDVNFPSYGVNRIRTKRKKNNYSQNIYISG